MVAGQVRSALKTTSVDGDESMAEIELAKFEIPAILISAVVLIAMATLLLHVLFPAAKGHSTGAAFDGQPGRCPVCQQIMDEVRRHGMRIQICARCQRVWTTKAAR
jgi:hypothetical protein